MDNVLMVSIREAARRLGVCPRTVTNLIEGKELASRRIGRRRMIPVAGLEAFTRRDHAIKRKPVDPELTADAKPDAGAA
jgi:excisionase family DNA binding protein